jgi:glycosyltransferase involved in cell wall biosynthesis
MPRVLHLLDSAADSQARRSAVHLAESGSVRTLGRGGNWPGAAGALRALRRTRSDYDLLHTWGVFPLTLGALAGYPRIIFSPPPALTHRSVAWLRAVMQYREVRVVAATATQRRALVERGVPLERCHLIRPGVEFSRIRRRRDPGLRAALGLGDDDFVLLAAGESTVPANHRDAVWSASILHVLDSRYTLLLWGRGAALSSVLRFAGRLGNPHMLRVAEHRLRRALEFEELLPAADMVLVTADGPVAALPICTAMAAGLPIVSTVTYTLGELLEDRHTALMVPTHSPSAIAQRILQLREDRSLQWAVSDMARTEAYEYFSLTRFLSQWRAFYDQYAAGQPVEVPELRPGPGLRFHGRV